MDPDHQDLPSFWRSSAGLTLLMAFAAVAFYLLTEHTAHVFGALPYVFLLACPLMHVFMHRGHGRKGRRDGSTSSRSSGDE